MCECLYSEASAGILFSLMTIMLQYKEIYLGWSLFANTHNDTGYLHFINVDGVNHATINMYCEDCMWFHYLQTGTPTQTTIRKLSTRSEFKL